MEKFNNAEVLRAKQEIEGVYNQLTEAELLKGLKKYPMSIGVKQAIDKISMALNAHIESYDKFKKEIILKYFPDGIDDQKEVKLKELKDENYLKMIGELQVLHICPEDEKFEVEYKKIQLSKIEDVVTEYDFSWLLSKIAE